MKVISFLKQSVRRFYQLHPAYRQQRIAIDRLSILAAQGLINEIKSHSVCKSLEECEFKVFSQFGDDGIIQYLIHQAGSLSKRFIEFGVGTYTECNTRFLLENNDWDGLVFDGDEEGINYIHHESLYWLHNLTAVTAFLTCDNINTVFKQYGYSDEIGLLSIDIDGNDYWIWEKIEVVNPVIVVIEYNALFGRERAVAIPYDPSFNRYHAHYSGLYWGASLKAFCHLAKQKGYVFVGCNSAGNNAYFVRKDRLGKITPQTPEAGFRMAKWRDSRDKRGRLNFLSHLEKLEEIKSLYVIDVVNGEKICVNELRGEEK
jgi:hypothetical protein